MTTKLSDVAQKCLHAAYAGTMDFPEIVGTLIGAGFEGYNVDYRAATATYFLTDGTCFALNLPEGHEPVAKAFDAASIQRAIREAQTRAPGYTYAGFCSTVMAAGCAGYMVSFLGKRAVYYGRTAETHVEHFPQ